MKNPKLVIGIVAIFALLIIFYFVYKNSQKTIKSKSGTTVSQAGFMDVLLNIFKPKGNSSSTGGGAGGGGNILCKIFPKVCGGGQGNCVQGKPSANDPCIDDCGFIISSDENPACV